MSAWTTPRRTPSTAAERTTSAARSAASCSRRTRASTPASSGSELPPDIERDLPVGRLRAEAHERLQIERQGRHGPPLKRRPQQERCVVVPAVAVHIDQAELELRAHREDLVHHGPADAAGELVLVLLLGPVDLHL